MPMVRLNLRLIARTQAAVLVVRGSDRVGRSEWLPLKKIDPNEKREILDMPEKLNVTRDLNVDFETAVAKGLVSTPTKAERDMFDEP